MGSNQVLRKVILMNKPENSGDISISFEDLIRQANECLECGKCTAACPMAELFPGHFNPHRLLEKILDDLRVVPDDKQVWLCASCYRCNKRCPQGIELPEIFLKLRAMALENKTTHNLEEALKIIEKKIPFARSFFQVCFHPERLSLQNEVINIFFPENIGNNNQENILHPDKKLAVIGSGPAGLYTAHALAVKGYPVTVFEARNEAGGMMQRSIPEYRITDEIINHEIDSLEKAGIKFKRNKTITKRGFKQLFREGFRAIFVATGAHKCQNLGIPGEDLQGVTDTLTFLEELKNGTIKGLPDKVIVIGGGNTAMDAASTAARYGAKEVIILYRRSEEEIPADKNEIREVLQDGARIQYLVAPLEFTGKDSVEKVKCIKISLGPPDLSGRKSPVPVEGSEFELEAGAVVIAIGEKPSVDFLPQEVMINKNGTIAVDPLTMETSMQGVFAGGDAVYGPATVSEAILSAQKAAEAIENYLKNNESNRRA